MWPKDHMDEVKVSGSRYGVTMKHDARAARLLVRKANFRLLHLQILRVSACQLRSLSLSLSLSIVLPVLWQINIQGRILFPSSVLWFCFQNSRELEKTQEMNVPSVVNGSNPSGLCLLVKFLQ